jgi:DNA repair protein RadD
MSSPPDLRPYQSKLLADIDNAWLAGYRRPLVVLPTGGGKTVIFAEAIRREVAQRRKALAIAHRREIIGQTSSKLLAAGVVHGIVMAGVKPRPTLDVQVASVQTLFVRGIRNETMPMPAADLGVIDEAHHTPAASYQQIVEAYPETRWLGFTATPERADGRGLGGFFDVLIEGPQVPELIALGFLVPTRVYAPSTPDLTGVETRGGDYVASQLAERMDKAKLVGDIVENWHRHGEARKTVVFASSVAHSVHLRDTFLEAGIRAAHIDGSTPKDERDAALAQLASGEVTVLSNCMVLTEGWDCPDVGCCVLARPTKSMGLYRQMIGRVLRPAAGKGDATIIDHAGCVFRHGFAEDCVEWILSPDSRAARNKTHEQRGDRKPNSRIVECTNCSAMRTAGAPCGHCGFKPETRPRYVYAADGELGLIDRKRRVAPHEWTQAQKLDFFGQLIAIAQERGWKPGFAAAKYREKFGTWPPWPRELVPPRVEPTPEVRAWVKSRAIAWAKAQDRGAA